MPRTCILFGSIGTIAETSDIQRMAYNRALEKGVIDWTWDRETYTQLLEMAGGKERLTLLSRATNADLTSDTIETIHENKTRIAGEMLRKRGLEPRPGVAALIEHARANDMKLGFVTTTYEPNIEALFAALGDSVSRKHFDYIGTREDVDEGKPDPQCYVRALEKIGVAADEAIAIEDTANSVMAARRAGVTTIATPGEFTAGQDFWQADLVVEALSDADGKLRSEVTAMLD